MKRFLSILTLVAALSMSGVVIADAAITIAVVDFQQALNGVDEGAAAKKKLETEFKKKQKQLDIQQKELEALKNEIQQQAAILPQEKLLAKQEDFRKQFLELQQKAGAFQKDMLQRESEMSNKILGRLKAIVEEIGRKGNYTLVIETSNDPILYVQSKEDLTAQVIKEYNKKY